MAMTNSILITGGHIIDPARNINEVGDILISGDTIVDGMGSLAKHGMEIIRAEGCLVVPGLIDFHTHIFFGGTESSIQPDSSMLPNCVTTTVDGGTAGTSNYEIFHKNVIVNSIVRIKSFLSVSPPGQATLQFNENQDPGCFDEERMKLLFRKYPDDILGLKVRQSKDIVGNLGMKPLEKALKVAEQLSCRVAVHTTDPFGDAGDLVNLLRPGDIFVHVYHGKGSTIINHANHVLPEVIAARDRGVIFDAANGKNHFSFKIAEAALADGFTPDVISSDLTWLTMYKQPVFGLPWIMSKYLALGMDLYDIIAACTATPAGLMGLEGKIGTLAAGACADVAIMKLADQHCEFLDAEGETRIGRQLLLPQATICAGRIVYRQMNF